MPISFTDMWYQKYYNGSYHNLIMEQLDGLLWFMLSLIQKYIQELVFLPFGNHRWYCNGIFSKYCTFSSILHESGVQRTDKRRTIISYNMEGLERKSRFVLKINKSNFNLTITFCVFNQKIARYRNSSFI